MSTQPIHSKSIIRTPLALSFSNQFLLVTSLSLSPFLAVQHHDLFCNSSSCSARFIIVCTPARSASRHRVLIWFFGNRISFSLKSIVWSRMDSVHIFFSEKKMPNELSLRKRESDWTNPFQISLLFSIDRRLFLLTRLAQQQVGGLRRFPGPRHPHVTPGNLRFSSRTLRSFSFLGFYWSAPSKH